MSPGQVDATGEEKIVRSTVRPLTHLAQGANPLKIKTGASFLQAACRGCMQQRKFDQVHLITQGLRSAQAVDLEFNTLLEHRRDKIVAQDIERTILSMCEFCRTDYEFAGSILSSDLGGQNGVHNQKTEEITVPGVHKTKHWVGGSTTLGRVCCKLCGEEVQTIISSSARNLAYPIADVTCNDPDPESAGTVMEVSDCGRRGPPCDVRKVSRPRSSMQKILRKLSRFVDAYAS